MSRITALETLKEFFTSKGKFLTMEEYKEAEDAPIRFQAVKRLFGSWSRLKGLVGDITPVAAPVTPAPKPTAKPAAKPQEPAEPEEPAGEE